MKQIIRHWAAGLACLTIFGSGPDVLHAAETVDLRRDAVVEAVERVIPTVVNIATETIIERHDWYDELLRNFYGWPGRTRQERSVNLGSGVIIDEEGYILTNFHVVSRASRVQVKLWDGREYEADRIVATPGSDVALLKLRAKPGEKFKAITLAPDDDLLLGETVLALGNPFGLGSSVSRGILSSKNRRPSTGGEPLNVEDWLQTDAAINPGNSGGPLVNLRSELIGLNVAVHRDQRGERGVGVSFSIPVKQVSAAISRFFAPEVESLWFGADLTAGQSPAQVSAVVPGSPAAKAGLRVGDRILRVNGREQKNLVGLNRALVSAQNHECRITLMREGRAQEVVARLIPFDQMLQQRLGLTLLEPSPQTAQRMGLNTGEGLFVDGVEKSSPAEKAGVQRGYILTGIDSTQTRELRAVGEVLSRAPRNETLRLTFIVPRRLGGNYVEFRQGTVDVQAR